MPSTVNSPNMGLVVPVVGVQTGPAWANNLFTDLFSTIDAHDHSAGKGVQITPAGLNISADLPFGSNNATALRSVRFTQQAIPLSSGGDVGCLSDVLGNLFWNNGAGAAVQLTNGTQPAATGTLLAPVTATGRNVSGTFTIDSSGADAVIFLDSTASAFALTLPVATANRVLFLVDTTGKLGTNAVTLTPRGGELINGVNAGKALSAAWAIYLLISNGTNWWIRGI